MHGVKVEQRRVGPEIAIFTCHGHKNDGAQQSPDVALPGAYLEERPLWWWEMGLSNLHKTSHFLISSSLTCSSGLSPIPGCYVGMS